MLLLAPLLLSLSFSCFPGLERRRGRDKEEKKRAAGAEKRKKRSKKPEEEAHLGVVDEVRDGRGQEIGLGLEVRVEDRDVVVVRQLLEPFFQCTGLVALAVGPAQSVAVDATLAPLGDLVVDEVARRLVGRVVEDLGVLVGVVVFFLATKVRVFLLPL